MFQVEGEGQLDLLQDRILDQLRWILELNRMMIKMITMMQNMMNGMVIQFHYSIWEIMMMKIKKLTLPTIMLIEEWKKEDRESYSIICQKNHQ